MTRLETIIMPVGAGQPGPESTSQGPEKGPTLSLDKRPPEEQQIIRKAVTDQLFSTPERQESLKQLTPYQINAGVELWLSQQPRDRADGIMNNALENDRQRKTEAQAAGGTEERHVLKSMDDLTSEQIDRLKQTLDPQDFDQLKDLRPEAFQGYVGGFFRRQEEWLRRGDRAGSTEGGNRGSGSPPEGGRPGDGDKEWEPSPERGRSIVEQIIELECRSSYEVRYNETNGSRLNRLYKELQEYVGRICISRNVRKSSQEERDEAVASIQASSVAQEIQYPPQNLPDRSIKELTSSYDTPGETSEAEKQLQIYFKEAKRKGLLKGVDQILEATYRDGIKGNAFSDQQERFIDQNLARAVRTAEAVFRAQRHDPEVARLAGVWNVYIAWARDRFDLALIGEEQPPHREGEFRFDLTSESQSKEIHWQPSSYPDYYIVTATTPEEFIRAKESFLQMIKEGSLGRSPDKTLPHLENFAKALGQRGLIQEQAGTVSHQFMEELRQEFEGLSYVYGADYTNETYNPENYYKFMMALALHEGPQRWVRLARAGQGGVGAFLKKFDDDPRIALFYNSGGSRGQIGNDTVTQNYFQEQIREILIEEGMGVVLKDYDPRDAEPNPLHSFQALKVNLERIGIHQPEKDFKDLYEGFDDGSTHIANYINFRDRDLSQASDRLKDSVAIGKVQTMLKDHRGMSKGKLIKEIDKLIKTGQLNQSEKKVWEFAYDQSESNFKIAFQMVGATGEKVRRGGGVLYIDRKDKGVGIVESMPVYQAMDFVQYAITRTKILHANSPAKTRSEAVAKVRRDAIQQIQQSGFEAKLVLPKIKFNEAGDVVGAEGNRTETIDFQSAIQSVYTRWTSHSYWGYQQENRHMLLTPRIFEAAKRIRAGKSQSEKEDLLATQLLIIDPTLKRVKSLSADQMAREIMLLEAAVEESNQGHWQIDRELHEAFLPKDGDANKIRVGYNREDFGGTSRYIITAKEYVAAHPKRFARRFAAEIAHAPMHVSSFPDIVGQKGMMGLIEMFADPMGDIAGQRVASQFSITKFVNQMRYGSMMFSALFGTEDSEKGVSVEGLYEKPTNNADRLAKYFGKDDRLKKYLADENDFFYALKETFGRLERVLQLIRVMESDVRNTQGVSLTEEKEVFLSNGEFNPEIAKEESRNTGSGRHSEKVFFDSYINWLLSDKPGGGMQAYPSEAKMYKFLEEKYFYMDVKGNRIEDGRTWADWLFDKMGR